jgi:hypothetical protein
MPKPTMLEHHRYVGDKRTQVVYDMDLIDSDARVAKAVADIVANAQFLVFGPDTLTEARNRCYKPDRSIREAAATS